MLCLGIVCRQKKTHAGVLCCCVDSARAGVSDCLMLTWRTVLQCANAVSFADLIQWDSLYTVAHVRRTVKVRTFLRSILINVKKLSSDVKTECDLASRWWSVRLTCSMSQVAHLNKNQSIKSDCQYIVTTAWGVC